MYANNLIFKFLFLLNEALLGCDLPDNDTATFSDDVDRVPELSNVQSDGRSSHIVIRGCDGE